jgi:hypothetical protein
MATDCEHGAGLAGATWVVRSLSLYTLRTPPADISVTPLKAPRRAIATVANRKAA